MTRREPVKSFVQKMTDLKARTACSPVSLGHGFPWGDVADMGTRLVITDDDPAKGAALAKALATNSTPCDSVQPRYFTIDAALDAAVASAEKPVVLADVSDNAGGGAPNDSTFILRRLLERNMGNAAIGCIWDPIVVETATEVGEGVELEMRIGGKMGPMSGDPVDMRVRIGKIARNATQRFGDGTNHLGDTVALHGPNGIDVVAISHRSQTFSPEVFTNVGIDPLEKQILVVKSTQHFYARFAPIAAQVLYVAAPGALVLDFGLLPYVKARRTLWPIAE
ncbi:MAG: MlrC C-terminal domain-containing protein [Caldilineaceae bacterium]